MRPNGKSLVDRRIIDDIGNKLVALRERHGVFIGLFRSVNLRSLEKEALIHSYKIEYPGSLKEVDTDYTCHPSRKSVKKGVHNLNEAFKWGMDNFNQNNIKDSFIKGVAGRIDPDLFKEEDAEYRKIRVSIKGASWRPPQPSEVPGEIQLYLENIQDLLKEQTFTSTLEAAAYAHLHLDRIHPFVDGNGRTARTVQNIILIKNNLPPTVLYAGERLDYFKRLEGAIEDWMANGGHAAKNKPSSNRETDFYNYIAGKVSASLDRLL